MDARVYAAVAASPGHDNRDDGRSVALTRRPFASSGAPTSPACAGEVKSNQPHALQARMPLPADDEVVVERDAELVGG